MKKRSMEQVIKQLHKRYNKLVDGHQVSVVLNIEAKPIQCKTKVVWDEDVYSNFDGQVEDAISKAVIDYEARLLKEWYENVQVNNKDLLKTDKAIRQLVDDANGYAAQFDVEDSEFWNRVVIGQ